MDAAAAWYSLGLIALHQEDYPSARQDFMNYFHADQSMNNKIDTCRLLIALAAVAGGTEQAERCSQLYGAAQVLFDTINYRLRPIDQTEFDRLIQRAREQLGNTRFEVLAVYGRAMTMEQAVAYALEDSE
jgi:hypothetical protein